MHCSAADDMLPVIEVQTSFPWRYLGDKFNVKLVESVAELLDIPTSVNIASLQFIRDG